MRISADALGLSRFVYSPARLGMAVRGPGATDAVRFSRFEGKPAIGRAAVLSWESRLTRSDDEKTLRLMDDAIANIGGIMERMKSLTKLAADKSLSDVDRIDIQLDLVRLNKELNLEKRRMSLRMAGQSEEEIARNTHGIGKSADWAAAILGRARKRAEDGEAWDAAEVYQPEERLTAIQVRTADGGAYFFEPTEEFTLPSDIDPDTAVIIKRLVPAGGSMIVADDPNVSTVSAILAGMNVPLAMDAKTAGDMTQKLDAQLDQLLKVKRELAEAVQESRAAQPESRSPGSSGQFVPGASPDPDGKAGRESVWTDAGEMVYRDGDRSAPVLQNPRNAAGRLFAKLAKSFEEKIGHFSDLTIRPDGKLAVGLSTVSPRISA